jgi:hypothetical protein
MDMWFSSRGEPTSPRSVQALEGAVAWLALGGAPEKPQQSYKGDLGEKYAETQCFVSVRR